MVRLVNLAVRYKCREVWTRSLYSSRVDYSRFTTSHGSVDPGDPADPAHPSDHVGSRERSPNSRLSTFLAEFVRFLSHLGFACLSCSGRQAARDKEKPNPGGGPGTRFSGWHIPYDAILAPMTLSSSLFCVPVPHNLHETQENRHRGIYTGAREESSEQSNLRKKTMGDDGG